MTKTSQLSSVLAALALALALGACQKPADLDKLKQEWDAEVKVFADETKQLARWQLLLEKKRTELSARGPARLVDQAQGPLTQSGEELRQLLTDIEKKIGPEAEARRKAGKVIDLVKYTDDTAEHLRHKLDIVRNQLDAAESLLTAAEQTQGRVAMGAPSQPTQPTQPTTPALPDGADMVPPGTLDNPGAPTGTAPGAPTRPATGATTGGSPAPAVGTPPDRGSGATNNPAAPTNPPAGH